jgi:hypothetical protein
MIAYNKFWLTNNIVLSELDTALAANLTTANEQAAAKPMYKSGFYTPNLFVRIGLFILTAVVIIFSFGLFSLMILSAIGEKNIGELLLFFGLVCYASLEWFVASRHHYQSGVDDALIWISVVFIIAGINIAADIAPINNAVLVFILAAWFTLRFIDRLLLIFATIALLAVVFFMLQKMGATAKAVTPFVLMFTAALLYFLFKKIGSKQQLYLYRQCFTMGTITSLLCFYIAGNYFVVREVSNLLFNLELQPGESIPFAWLFWFFTVLIPLLYILWGILKKDIILLRTGLLLVTAIVFTIRYYHHLWSLELVMITGGVFFIVVAYALTSLLKIPKAGFTAQPLQRRSEAGIQQIESIIIAETMTVSAADNGADNFGGGSFGGGGASEDF